MNRHTGILILSSVLLASCERDAPLAPRAPPVPVMEIADASRDPGRAHFYFLPPMAAKTAYAGAFDASVLPRVEIVVCELSANSCDRRAAFTAQGQKLQRVWTSQLLEHFLAVWRTDGPDVNPDKIYRVIVLVGGNPLGHADVNLVRTLDEARSIDRAEYAVWPKGLPLPIRFRIEAGAVTIVDPTANEVKLTAAGGAVELTFPIGASGPIGVTVTAATDLPPGPIEGTAFHFRPDGAEFQKPVRLSIRYDPAAVPAGVDQRLLRLHKLEDATWMEVAGSTVDAATHFVSADIRGFSYYSVLPLRPDPVAGQIAFVSDRMGNNEIFLMNEQGRVLSNLTNDAAADDREPLWSPTGEQLAFVSTNSLGNDDVFVTGAAGTQILNVSNRSELDGSPSWAPGASTPDLFFAGRVDCPSTFQGFRSRIFVGHSSGGAARQLNVNASELDGGPCVSSFEYDKPLVSPDGARLALTWFNGDGDVFEIASTATGEFLDGRNSRSPACWITDQGCPFRIGGYAWLPASSDKIALSVVDVRDGANSGVYLVDLGTRTAVKLFDDPAPLLDLVWSPAGDKLAFTSQRDGVSSEVYVFDLASSALINLTNNPADDGSPTWSPAGDKIAFVTNRDGDEEIYVMDLASGALTRLTHDPARDHSPRWRP